MGLDKCASARRGSLELAFRSAECKVGVCQVLVSDKASDGHASWPSRKKERRTCRAPSDLILSRSDWAQRVEAPRALVSLCKTPSARLRSGSRAFAHCADRRENTSANNGRSPVKPRFFLCSVVLCCVVLRCVALQGNAFARWQAGRPTDDRPNRPGQAKAKSRGLVDNVPSVNKQTRRDIG